MMMVMNKDQVVPNHNIIADPQEDAAHELHVSASYAYAQCAVGWTPSGTVLW